MFGVCDSCGRNLKTQMLPAGAIVLGCDCQRGTKNMPKVRKATDAEWMEYYRKQRDELDKELKDKTEALAWADEELSRLRTGKESQLFETCASLQSRLDEAVKLLNSLLEQFKAYRGGWLKGWVDRIGLPSDIEKANAFTAREGK